MRGSIRRRGDSWEYIVDIGTAAAQRCQGCKRRFWVERKPKESCPKCGGELAETEERRRAIKGGFATRRECEAALAKVLAAVEAQTFTPPTKVTVKAFLLERVAAHRQGQPAPDDLRKLRDARHASTSSRVSAPCSCRSSARRRSTPSTPTSQNTGASTAAGRCRPPRCAACTPSCTAPVTTPCAGDGSQRQPGRWRRSAQGKCRAPRQAAGLDRRAARRLPRSVADDRLFALWRLLAMTGMRRGEALGLAWEDVDMEAGAVTIRGAWIPVNGVAQFSEPKSRRSRRTIALDPVTLEALRPTPPVRPTSSRAGRRACRGPVSSSPGPTAARWCPGR